MAVNKIIPLAEGLIGKSYANLTDFGLDMKGRYDAVGDEQSATLANDLGIQISFGNFIYAFEAGPQKIRWNSFAASTQGSAAGPHIYSQVVHYGEGLFEGMKIVRDKNGVLVLVHPDENFDRMRQGAGVVHYSFDYKNEKLTYLSLMLAQMNGWQTCWPKIMGKDGQLKDATVIYVRPVLISPYGTGVGIGGRHRQNLVILLNPMKTYFDKTGDDAGVNALLHFTNIQPGFSNYYMSLKHNSNYALNGHFKRMALGIPDAAETIIMNNEMLKEGSSDTVGIIRGNNIVFPPLTTGRLNGITMRLVEKLSKDLGFGVLEDKIGFDDIQRSRGLLLFGNAVDFLGVNKLYVRLEEIRGSTLMPYKVETHEIFGKPTKLAVFKFNTTETELFRKIKAAFETVYTENTYGKYAISTDDVFRPGSVEVFEALGKKVRKIAQNPKTSIVDVEMPNLLRRDAVLTLPKRLYPQIGRRKVDNSWSNKLKRQPVLLKA